MTSSADTRPDAARPAWNDPAGWHFLLRRQALGLARRIDARPARTRVLIALGLAAVLLLLADPLWLQPAFARWRTASQALATARADAQAVEDAAARRRLVGDARRQALQAEIAQWRARTSQAAQGLSQAQAGLVGPEAMVGLLQQLLPRQGGLRVVALKTLAPVDLRAAAAAPAARAETGATLYRHGVEISVEGPWAELMGWLAALESAPGPRLLWGDVLLEVEQHPTVRLTLTVHTLSLDRAWLEL